MKEKGRKRKKRSRKDNEKQKKDEACNKIPPKPNNPQEIVVSKINYPLWIQHVAWTDNKLEDCWLGKDHSDCLKPSPQINFHSNATIVEKVSKSFLRAIMSQLVLYQLMSPDLLDQHC